ncbi:MAG: trypsin-like peptidase domain-containing protein [Anaerolineae bacterium]|nr:trypsin-like peptidase domain-containing protein [Anaerolineae bacterium]
MTERLKPAIVRLWDINNKIIGAGVLVGSRQVITCAHVIRDALNISTTPEQIPAQEIKLDFPFPASKNFLLAQVKIWKPRQEDGSGDIAVLEITNGLIPSVSRPVKWITPNDISELVGHNCLAYGFPENYDTGVWSFDNKIQDERSGGTVQITNQYVTGHRIQKGFSGGAIWDKELQGVVGIITTADNQENNKVAFMLPTKAISKICPLPEVDNEDATVMEIPFIVLAMTQPQIQDLLEGEIFQRPEVARIVGDRFAEHKNLLENDGIQNLRELYGNKPEDWMPQNYSGLTIEQVIWKTLNHHNEEHRHSEEPIVLPKFLSEDFYSDTQAHQIAKKMFEQRGGIIIIDAISLHHPDIYKRLSSSGLLTNDKTAVLIISPSNKNTLAKNNLIEKVIRDNMEYAFDRFETKCDPSCEIGVVDVNAFKRWFINTLHKISAEKQSMQETNRNRFKNILQHTPKHIHQAWINK